MLLAGCASIWERTFEYEPGLGPGTYPASGSVVVRSVPWERVAEALAAERRAVVESHAHRQDWPPEQAREVERLILAAVQPPGELEGARLIGRSRVISTSPPDPRAADLESFARRIGADYAAWSGSVVRTVPVTTRESVYVDRWIDEQVWDARRKRFRTERRYVTERIDVPTVVQRDEVRYVVFYVRTGEVGQAE